MSDCTIVRQVTIVASEQYLYQTIVLPRKLQQEVYITTSFTTAP